MARKKGDVTFSSTEYNVLELDLARAIKALKEGHGFALSELETIYKRVTGKRVLHQEYSQVITY